MAADKLDDQALRRFHDDFRRALLMQRKGRLRCFFKLLFPNENMPFDDEVDVLGQLDFRNWLTVSPNTDIAEYHLYREISTHQEKLIQLAASALDAAAGHVLKSDQFILLAQTMHDMDRVANRLISGYTNTLTDIDRLTGLLNRAAMDRDLALEVECSGISLVAFSIAMVDLDYFKKVNDTYGHLFGDIVLENMAERFVESLRPGDRVYRYGGEEFLVILPKTSLDSAKPVIERLSQIANRRPISNGVTAINQSVSIGLIEVGIGETPEAAIQRADNALYRAKESGRNCIKVDIAKVVP